MAGADESRLERFLFAPADPRTVSGVRIALAVIMAVRFHEYADWELSGRFDSPALRDLLETYAFNPVHNAIALALIVLFGLGVAPRLIGWSLLFVLAPRALDLTRSPSAYLMLCLLLSFVWLRSDARWAVRIAGGPGPKSPGPVWPLRLMQLLLSLLYGVNALAKSTPAYLSGDVLAALSTRPNWLMDFSGGFADLGVVAVPLWVAGCGSAATAVSCSGIMGAAAA